MSEKAARHASVMFCAMICAALFVFPDTANESVIQSAKRCAFSLLPGLFPMMVSARQIADCLRFGQSRLLSVASGIIGMPQKLVPIFLIGLLCGYPVPAVICAAKYKNGELSREEAEYAAAITNNSSPAYLVFCVGNMVFGSISAGIFLYIAQIIACMAAARLIQCDTSDKICRGNPPQTFAENIRSCAYTFVGLCGFVIFFSLAADLVSLIMSYLGAPQTLSVIVSGLTEITGGITKAASLASPAREILICLFSSCGGVSVFFQISASLSGTGISMKKYIVARCLISVIVTVLFQIFLIFSF